MNNVKHASQRVGIFIDVSNLYHSSKNLYKKNVNFKAIFNEAVGDRKLVRAFA